MIKGNLKVLRFNMTLRMHTDLIDYRVGGQLDAAVRMVHRYAAREGGMDIGAIDRAELGDYRFGPVDEHGFYDFEGDVTLRYNPALTGEDAYRVVLPGSEGIYLKLRGIQ